MRPTWISCVAIVAARLVITCTIGCGAVSPQLIAFNDNWTEEDACLDIWSLVHVGTGYYLGHLLEDEGLLSGVALLSAYELAEPHFWPGFNESELNQGCDVVVGTLGWTIERQADD